MSEIMPSATAEDYLRRLSHALQPLPDAERAEIVAELRSHLADRHAQALQSVETTLEAMGPPEDYARRYVEDFELSSAMNRAAPLSLLAAILARAPRSVAALMSGGFATASFVLAGSFALIGVLKLLIPSNVGLWLAPNFFEFGAVGQAPPDVSERLGLWIIPLCIALAVAFYLAARTSMRAGGRALLKRARQTA